MSQNNGERYEATVPDTLDLAKRAEYAINALTGALDEKHGYEYIWQVWFAPFKLIRHSVTWYDSNPRAAWSLPLMRVACGSNHNADVEKKLMESMMSRVGDDGLFYNLPYDDDAPWRRGGVEYNRAKQWRTDEDVSAVFSAGTMLAMYATRYEKEGDASWLEQGERTVRKLIEIAVYKKDYAYFPATIGTGLDFAWFRNSGWGDTEEALDDMSSPEGTATSAIAIVVHGLCRWCAATGNQDALELAGKLVKYIIQPQFWMGNIESWAKWFNYGYVRGHGGRQRKPAALFKMHQAGAVYVLHGLIEYAVVANDAYVKEWVRQAYEYYRNIGLVRLGMWGENIANNLMVAIAIKLSDSGIGDYWDDVDQYVRNTMVEDQFIDAEPLKQACKERGGPMESEGFTIERFIGSLRWFGSCDFNGTLDPTHNTCVAAGPYLEPLFFAWESIVRCQDGAAQINLLLNRASPWLDVDSYLPFEGKAVIHNKSANTISIRIPCWVDRKKLTFSIDGTAAGYTWTGNFLSVSGLNGSETLTVEFPMVETNETYHLVPWELEQPWHIQIGEYEKMPTYHLTLKGNTCIDVDFENRNDFLIGCSDLREKELNVYPVYQREHYRANTAPMKKVTRYVFPGHVSW